ncbi:MAG TPA: glucose-1-phosphate thymidylyltransferase, partial [Dehalococcoidia bacterium]
TVAPSIRGTVDEGSQVQGNGVLEEGAVLVESVVHGPAVIGRNTRIEHAYVGPFTSIYHDCTIRNAEIGGSVVLEHTVIEDLPHRIEGSLIGRFVSVRGNHRRPRSYRLVLGDHSSVSTP